MRKRMEITAQLLQKPKAKITCWKIDIAKLQDIHQWTKNYTRSLNRNMELYPDNEEAFYFCDDLTSIF
jgi:hypothetical protein